MAKCHFEILAERSRIECHCNARGSPSIIVRACGLKSLAAYRAWAIIA